MSGSDSSTRDRLVALLRAARRVLAFTGAGISTASGIPDFRGPQGVWTRRRPVYIEEFLADEDARVEYWDQKAEGWSVFRAAAPNAAHRALVTLERAGRLHALVTQNIDGLHQRAGSSEGLVQEIHGTNRSVECLSCGGQRDPDEPVARFLSTRRPPRCECGGLLKFATVSFGQAVPGEALERAARAARDADLVLALGSSLSVQPAAMVPLVAARRGTPYVIINRGPTEQDLWATLRIDADVTDVLPPATDAALSPR